MTAEVIDIKALQAEAEALLGPRLIGVGDAVRPTMIVPDAITRDVVAKHMTGYNVVTWTGTDWRAPDWEAFAGQLLDADGFTPGAHTGRVDLIAHNTPTSHQEIAGIGQLLIKLGLRKLHIFDSHKQPEGWLISEAFEGDTPAASFRAWAATVKKPISASVVEAKKPRSQRIGGRIGKDGKPYMVLWQEAGVDTSRGQPPTNEDTALALLTHKATPMWFDEFLQRPMMQEPDGTVRELSDGDYIRATIMFQRDYGMAKMSIPRVTAAIDAYCDANHRNIAQEWMLGLEWDNQERLKDLCRTGFGATDGDSEFFDAVGRCFIMGMVARVMTPGAQVDNMLVLEGPGGERKTSIMRIIGGEWFAEAGHEILSHDFLQTLRGKMLVLVDELHGMNRDLPKLKQRITARIDTYRASYGRHVRDYPRQCVFAGTTDRDDWVHADPNARRFWRVPIGKLDLDWVRANRTQLFAEAVWRVQAGEPWWDVPVNAARAMTDAARPSDPWHEIVARYVYGRAHVQPAEILTGALDLKPSQMDSLALARVRAVLRAMEWKSKSVRDGKRVMHAWVPPPSATPPKPEQDEDTPF